jgi:hypothetical protein
VNERIAEVGWHLDPANDVIDFLCECGDQSCIEHVPLTLADYAALREEGPIMKPGHS